MHLNTYTYFFVFYQIFAVLELFYSSYHTDSDRQTFTHHGPLN